MAGSLRSNFSDQFLEDALPVLDALVYEEYEKRRDDIPVVFNMRETSRWGEQSTTMAGIKAAVQKNEGENVAFDDPIQGFDRTYIPITFAIAVSFSQELVEDDRLDMVDKTYRSLGKSMYQTRQITAFGVLNDGFADTGPDGVSLFNTAHPLIGGGTYQNRPSTDIALSVAGLRELEVDMIEQPDHRNINITVMPECIVTPAALSQTAWELLRSPERPDTANRALNTFFPTQYKLVVSPFLTSSTAWFGFTDPSEHELRFYDRVAPQTETWVDRPSGDVNTKIRARFVSSYSDWMGAWGTTG